MCDINRAGQKGTSAITSAARNMIDTTT